MAQFDRENSRGYSGQRFWLKEYRRVSLYLVHFKWKEKEIELMAKSLDLTHPYFVSIKGLVFPTETRIVINPLEEEVRKTFGRADHLMIPFQTVTLIEELPEGADSRVVPFELIEAPDREASGGGPVEKEPSNK